MIQFEDIKKLVPFRRRKARADAYKAVFSPKGVDSGLSRAAEIVLQDLAHFCHFMATTHCTKDPDGIKQLEGRRQVYLRLIKNLNLSEAELMRIVSARYEADGVPVIDQQ